MLWSVWLIGAVVCLVAASRFQFSLAMHVVQARKSYTDSYLCRAPWFRPPQKQMARPTNFVQEIAALRLLTAGDEPCHLVIQGRRHGPRWLRGVNDDDECIFWLRVSGPQEKLQTAKNIIYSSRNRRTFRGARWSRSVGSVDELVDFERFFAARLSQLFDLANVWQRVESAAEVRLPTLRLVHARRVFAYSRRQTVVINSYTFTYFSSDINSTTSS